MLQLPNQPIQRSSLRLTLLNYARLPKHNHSGKLHREVHRPIRRQEVIILTCLKEYLLMVLYGGPYTPNDVGMKDNLLSFVIMPESTGRDDRLSLPPRQREYGTATGLQPSLWRVNDPRS